MKLDHLPPGLLEFQGARDIEWLKHTTLVLGCERGSKLRFGDCKQE
ncbi:hypothetical protein [Variovorax guangxiensis]|uniref:Uncharacterized protein n=1 Tax=Variovorax guangxiensis TaxID=1775474 RepID=A0A840FUM3_9BURK|nr:hypothetical protein [Variovorax guangxiensis]MBB4225883.1 hypothetical protein [Variovorax guangxiensis]